MGGRAESTAIAPVRVACCQLAPEVGRKAANLARSTHFIERAARAGARVVVLPELCSSGYVFDSRAEACALSDAYADRETTTLWAGLARDLGLHIVGGFAERSASTLYNAAAHANSIYIAAADRVGTERGQPFIGQSLIAGYSGWPVGGPASATEEEIVVADLDLAQARRARRWNDFNQVLRDRRPEAYA